MSKISCTLKSIHGDTSLTLSDFHREYKGADNDSFIVAMTSATWHGEIRASSFMASDLGDFFINSRATGRAGMENVTGRLSRESFPFALHPTALGAYGWRLLSHSLIPVLSCN